MTILQQFCRAFAVLGVAAASLAAEITPYKYSDEERQSGSLAYAIPKSSRFTTKRIGAGAHDIIWYFSSPPTKNYPIAILVGGSSLENDIISIIHFHRYFLKEFLELGVGVITIEQQGVDGDHINKTEFMEHYTRSNRLNDHRAVIDHLKQQPPLGWNGNLIFLGVSEGGPIVTILTAEYSKMTLATINWSGAGDWSWRNEVWIFMQDVIQKTPWYIKLRAQLPSWVPYSLDLYLPKSRKDHDNAMDETIENPTANLKLAGMTYKYHADALKVYPKPAYKKIKTPYLVVAGTQDSMIGSADAFVRKLKKVRAPVTYMRIEDMDHFVRKRPDVIDESFAWLKQHLGRQNETAKVQHPADDDKIKIISG